MRRLCITVCCLLLVCCIGHYANAGEFSESDLRKMSVFLSNFTEIGLYTVRAQDFDDPNDPETAIRFGIWHNFVNNFDTRIKPCRGHCPNGSLLIDARHVTESIQRYTGVNFQNHQSVYTDTIRCSFDGKSYNFEGASGEEVLYARATTASRIGGSIRLSGELYNVEDQKDIRGSFTAKLLPIFRNGKPYWKLLSLESTL